MENTQTTPKTPKLKLDFKDSKYATGRRKTSIARVWLKRGTGLVKINGKEENKYFSSKSHRILLNQPLVLTQRKSEIDITCTVGGGGLSGQAGAIRHGIARALVKFEPDLRKNLKSKGLLTRDSRIVERKKYGKAKARRSYQFSKR